MVKQKKSKKPSTKTSQEKITKQEIIIPDEIEFFIAGLHKDTKQSDLQDHFEKCGDISSIKLVDEPSSKKRKFGFITFSSAVADSVLKLHKSSLLGKNIIVKPRSERAPKIRQEIDSNIIFVGNLPYNTNEDSIGNHFSKFGEIKEVRLARNPDQCLKGYCHIEYLAADSVKQALETDGSLYEGKVLKVDYAQKETQKKTLTRPYHWSLEN